MCSNEDRILLAKHSKQFNSADKTFQLIFPHLISAQDAAEVKPENDVGPTSTSSTTLPTIQTNSSNSNQGDAKQEGVNKKKKNRKNKK